MAKSWYSSCVAWFQIRQQIIARNILVLGSKPSGRVIKWSYFGASAVFFGIFFSLLYPGEAWAALFFKNFHYPPTIRALAVFSCHTKEGVQHRRDSSSDRSPATHTLIKQWDVLDFKKRKSCCLRSRKPVHSFPTFGPPCTRHPINLKRVKNWTYFMAELLTFI